MRTSKTISISMPPAQLRQAERLAKKQNRTMSELMREAFRHYAETAARREKLEELRFAVTAMREEASLTGAGKLTMRQIQSEVAAARKSAK
jgi:metal-responsive CopG/Arc/MetJ family transcriptional regulator